MMSSLNDIATTHHCRLTEYEIFGHYAIGMDTEKKFVFFVSKNGEELHQQYADLQATAADRFPGSTKGSLVEPGNLSSEVACKSANC